MSLALRYLLHLFEDFVVCGSYFPGFWFGVGGLGFGVWGLGFGVWGLEFGVWGLGFGVEELGVHCLVLSTQGF